MKLKQIIESSASLQYLLSLKLSAVLGYKLALLAKKLNPEVELYHKTRNEKLAEFGEEKKDDEGNVKPGEYVVSKEGVEKLNKELEELLESEITVDLPEIKIADFGDIQIEPRYLVELDWLIKTE